MKKIALISILFSFCVAQIKTEHTIGGGILFGLTNTSSGEYTNPQSRTAFSMYYYNNTYPIGIYIDMGGTGDFQSCENCYDFDDVYVESVFGDQFQEEDWAYTKTTIGTIVNISKYNFSIYGGLGFGEKSIGHRYYDSYHILGDSGRYWIESDTESLSSLSLGLIKYINLSEWGFADADIGIQLGYETIPKSIMLGITYQGAF